MVKFWIGLVRLMEEMDTRITGKQIYRAVELEGEDLCGHTRKDYPLKTLACALLPHEETRSAQVTTMVGFMSAERIDTASEYLHT